MHGDSTANFIIGQNVLTITIQTELQLPLHRQTADCSFDCSDERNSTTFQNISNTVKNSTVHNPEYSIIIVFVYYKFFACK
jgi:hypothetical protein